MSRCLYAATHSFTSNVRLGSHRYAEQFAQSGETLYIPHPLTPAGLLRKSSRKERLLQRALGGAWPVQQNLLEYTPKMLLASSNQPFLNSRFIANNAAHFSWPRLQKQVHKLGFDKPEILMIDTCYQSFWVDLVDADKLVVRVADNPAGFNRGFKGGVRSAWVALLEQAQLVVAVSEPLAEQVSQYTPNVLVCGNGIQDDFSAEPRPSEIREDRPVAVYVGAVESWLDIKMLVRAAGKLPLWQFIVIGPIFIPLEENLPPNLRFLGPKSHDQLGAYLMAANVGIVPFDVRNYPLLFESVDAIKLYEYLACKLQVVATSWPQSRSMEDYVFVVSQKPDEFEDALEQSIDAPKKAVPEETIRSWTWSARFQSIQSAINSL